MGSKLMLALAFAMLLAYLAFGALTDQLLGVIIFLGIAAVVVALWELRSAVQDLHISMLEKDLTKK